MRYLLFLPLVFVLTGGLSAQVPAPDFLCTRSEAGGEILTWTNVSSDCGPYQATEIYRSATADGPFSLLANIEDSSVTEYRDENPGGEQLFYYLQYRYDCPDTTFLTSDTLDSFIPVTPVVDFVSVVEGELIIYWQPSPSPEVNRYVIFEVTDAGGIVPLDTVGLQTSYTIGEVPTGEQGSRGYRVAALDACGNDSPQGSIVYAVGLEGTGGVGCESDIELSPLFGDEMVTGTPTLTGDDSLNLFVAVNGGEYTLYSTQSGLDPLRLTYADANDGDSLCFYLEFGYLDVEINQRTAVYCQRVDITQPVRDFELYGVEVGEGGRLRFAYDYPYPPPPAYDYALEQVGAGGRMTFPDAVDSLLSFTEVVTRVPIPVAPGDSLRFTLTDDCARTASSNYVTPVFLGADPLGDDRAVLQWSPLENGLPGTIRYNVYRVAADSTLSILATQLSELTYTDDDPTAGAVRCYRVEAVYTPADSTASFSFLSNIACVAQESEVYLPNVFSPRARQEVNQTFRPIFTNLLGINAYKLTVFDRWGGLLYAGEDPGVGWTGEVDGRLVPAGSYVYVLTFTTPRGNLVERSGVVHVLY
ncbi:gliding motility-associated C-terminal domain-containing protein [Lewinella sp. JB7]|uniref:T9SS type B sorting domain-containing protein n=1 Tax=Lewinella sp. JB7 TaxID=2962887 RepID=UPI0020C968F8|nr:gliding motility-associated C-terminal domain-containing protein [Lewinella sp. JB7]MCP9237853.1 gliding motility-associated C-terminal domain-containing protein [Lewinella sp. JB7]